MVAQIRKARPGNRADIPCSDYSYIHFFPKVSSLVEYNGQPHTSARYKAYDRLTRRQRTIAVVNSRVKRLCRDRSFWMGTSSSLVNWKGLPATNFSKFAM